MVIDPAAPTTTPAIRASCSWPPRADARCGGRAGDVIPLGPPLVPGPLPRARTMPPAPCRRTTSTTRRGAAAGERPVPGTADRRRGGAGRAPPAGARPAQPVDVLKVGHHGSESSTLPEMLAVLQPAVALISCGADNEYGPRMPSRSSTWPRCPACASAHRPGGHAGGDGRWRRHRRRRPHARDAGSIGPWWYPVAIRPCSCSIPSTSRRHRGPLEGVARVAAEAARLVAAAGVPVDVRLVEVAALLHDIDKPETRQGGGSTARSPPSAWPRWASRS